MPYDDFFAEVQRTRYDVEAVALFDRAGRWSPTASATWPTRDGAGSPPFLRVDVAGNISKRYSASGLRFPYGHGSCPKWAVHAAFMTPQQIAKQYSAMPDGQTYFCFARVISEPAAGSLVRGVSYSIGVGTTADHARHFVYADELPRGDVRKTAVPVGITCRFCERTDCNQRAAPSYKFAFAVDEHVKKDNFFSPITDADAPAHGHGHHAHRKGGGDADRAKRPGGGTT